MLIYNVTVKVTHAIAADWLTWMHTTHMPELKRTGLFTDYRLCRLLEQDEEDGVTYIAQYFCATRAEYDAYISEYAPLMREKSIAAFGNQFIAFRTLMQIEG